MRTALEMADFILSREAGAGPISDADKEGKKRRSHLADLFRPIDKALRDNTGLAAGAMMMSSTQSHRSG